MNEKELTEAIVKIIYSYAPIAISTMTIRRRLYSDYNRNFTTSGKIIRLLQKRAETDPKLIGYKDGGRWLWKYDKR